MEGKSASLRVAATGERSLREREAWACWMRLAGGAAGRAHLSTRSSSMEEVGARNSQPEARHRSSKEKSFLEVGRRSRRVEDSWNTHWKELATSNAETSWPMAMCSRAVSSRQGEVEILALRRHSA